MGKVREQYKEIQEQEQENVIDIEKEMVEKQFLRNSRNDIKINSLINIRTALENDDLLKDKFIYNEFSQEVEIKENFILAGTKFKQGKFEEIYTTAILEHLERKFHILFTDTNLNKVIVSMAMESSYHPVKDFMEDCYKNWDKVQRADTFLTEFLGAEQSELTALKTRMFFVGAVSKVYDPTIKFDYVLDLVGGQGTGKTTLLEKMGREWHTMEFNTFKDKDDLAVMLRALIVIDDEMAVSDTTPFGLLKKFITQRKIQFRRPYGRSSDSYDKNFVIARTTNIIDYQKDKTGARRYLPIFCSKENQTKTSFSDLNDELVKQYWGEFVSLYKSGFEAKLTQKQYEALEADRERFEQADELDDLINMYLSIKIPIDFYKPFENNSGKYARRSYISFALESGKEKQDSSFSSELEEREFILSSHFFWECMGVDIGKGRSKDSMKFRLIMQNKKDWQPATRMGKRGFKKKKY